MYNFKCINDIKCIVLEDFRTLYSQNAFWVSYNDRACNFLKIKDVEIILKLYIQAHEAVTLWTGRDDAETLACIRARS